MLTLPIDGGRSFSVGELDDRQDVELGIQRVGDEATLVRTFNQPRDPLVVDALRDRPAFFHTSPSGWPVAPPSS